VLVHGERTEWQRNKNQRGGENGFPHGYNLPE
jgi:hypothetical protein